MRRLLWLALACTACSLEVPPDPIQAGVLPTCASGSALQGGQCAAVSSLGAGSATSATQAQSASHAAEATAANYAVNATATRSVDPQQVIMLSNGTTPVTPSGPTRLDVAGGELQVGSGLVLARLARFELSNRISVTANFVPLPLTNDFNTNGASGLTVHLNHHAAALRVTLSGAVEGAGSVAAGNFTTCQINLQLVTGSTIVAKATAQVSAYGNDTSPVHEIPFYAMTVVDADPGDYNVNGTLLTVPNGPLPLASSTCALDPQAGGLIVTVDAS